VFFRQVLYRDLGCASYLLGDSGAAVVVDPRWDVETYLEIARDERADIIHVLDTHDHADHISGRERLARLTGARTGRPAAADEQCDDVILPGQELAIGALRLRALSTPGHRPNHLSFVVTDLRRAAEPWLVLTGDSLLVGDLARPDLVLDAEAGALLLHASLKPLLALGDHVEIWPAHVGGSLCGGPGMSAKTSSTIGFERRCNPLLEAGPEEFVHGLVSNIPPRPPNVDRIVSVNQHGRAEPPPLPELAPCELSELVNAGITVLDSRDPAEFDASHLADSINLPISATGVGTRAGWALAPDEPMVIVSEDADRAMAMASALHAVGLFETRGYVVADAGQWRRRGLAVADAASWELDRLAQRLRAGDVDLVDVRESSERVTGYVRGSHHLPLHRLRHGRSTGLPDRGLTTAVVCAAGMRAAFAASLLRRAGRRDVVRVANGGVGDLPRYGIELDRGA
jgi:glyoxylase-like metal-dependent hydrolase (beta-lactamase superfamily II)/rhodanese-related sulfurtransferase